MVCRYCAACTVVALSACSVAPRHDVNETATRRPIVGLVMLVTTPESKDFISRADRIAVFDNDGTLRPDLTASVQLVFALQCVNT